MGKQTKLINAVYQDDLPKVKRLVAQGAKPKLPVNTPEEDYCCYCITKHIELDPDGPTVVEDGDGKETTIIGSEFICDSAWLYCACCLLGCLTCSISYIALHIIMCCSPTYTAEETAFKAAFELALLQRKMDIFRYFVKECKLSPNHSDLLKTIEIGDTEAYALELVKLIMEEGKVTATTDSTSGLNPLYTACLYSSSEMVQYLMDVRQHSYAPIDFGEHAGLTPMDAAIQRCWQRDNLVPYTIVRYLITQKKINPHIATKDGITPLERAAITAPTLADQMRHWWETARTSLESPTLFTGSYCPVYAENSRAYLAPPSSPVPGW